MDAVQSSLTTVLFEDGSENKAIRLVDAKNVVHTFSTHVHDSYTLGVITRGERSIYVNGSEHTILAGEGFILDPLLPHSCGPVNETGHDYRIISLDANLMATAGRDGFYRANTPHFSCIRIPDNTLIIRLIKLLKNFDSGKSERDDILSLLGDIISKYADDTNPVPASESRRQLVVEARAILDACPEKPVSLKKLSDEMHFSPYYIDRVFREVIGVPLHVYQLQTRVKRAAETLVKTGSILEASYYFGFSDQSHFSRIFKKNVGVSPGRFLKTNKKRML
jgi:AraC-like DNA-binding protein